MKNVKAFLIKIKKYNILLNIGILEGLLLVVLKCLLRKWKNLFDGGNNTS